MLSVWIWLKVIDAFFFAADKIITTRRHIQMHAIRINKRMFKQGGNSEVISLISLQEWNLLESSDSLENNGTFYFQHV